MSKQITPGRWLIACLILFPCATTHAADPPVLKSDKIETPNSPKVALNEAEQEFVDMLAGSVLNGTFTIDGKEEAAPKREKYAIKNVVKTGNDSWIVTAQIKYGKVDLPVPVPVKVHWAGDTPMIAVTDMGIPGMGEGFTARVMFYNDHYAGMWWHGKVGGHMWGMIEKGKQSEDKPE